MLSKGAGAAIARLTNVLAVNKTVGDDPNNGSVYFGDPQTLIFGMNRALRFGVSEHALWSTDRLDFKMTTRVGYTWPPQPPGLNCKV